MRINRTTPKTQSALLEAMNEGQVTVDAHSLPSAAAVLVIATQNPVEHHGSYPLPESRLDRLLDAGGWAIPTATPSARFCAPKPARHNSKPCGQCCVAPTCWRCSRRSLTSAWMSRWSTMLCPLLGRRASPSTSRWELSPRGSQMLYRAAQAMAFLDGRSFCTPEDIEPLVVPVFAHRVVVNGLSSSTLKKSEQAEQVIQEIVDSTPVPI